MSNVWYPGHINKAKRRIKEYLKAVDSILIVLDARAPLATTAFEIDIFKGKNILFVLNKSDIANNELTTKWLQTIGQTAPVISFNKNDSISKIKNFVLKNSKTKLNETRLLIAGVPNVGKSSIINKISGKRSAKTGATPGITRGVQWINLGKIKLLDTPGIVFAKLFNKDIAAKLLLVGSLPIENIDNYDIISRAFDIYKTEANVEEDFEDYITKFGLSRGFISKGGKCDFERSKNIFFKLLSEGKLGKFTYDKDFSMWIYK
ncbi:GTPase [Thermosipho atlanticus]|uniref:Ribosome biogenesis GTPase A n=1 Tax=Thermosipho atlanticus DSM 15807 TaxID=1123380 RepID=A0A1M5T8U4_9BACT|nr:GTPase [Thermosipho atlanticus]SHH47185.1 Ras superfamily GTP-binding protein YlqF [Thermosipho atlanticus DSM 15807]